MIRDILPKLERELRGLRTARGPYLWAIKDFLRWSGGKADPEQALRYIDHREKVGDPPGTLRMRFYALKFFLNRVLGWGWRPREETVFASRERRLPPTPEVFGKEEVLETVRAVRAKGNAAKRAYFAVSTAYGCRRSEIADIRPMDLDFRNRFVRRHGSERRCL